MKLSKLRFVILLSLGASVSASVRAAAAPRASNQATTEAIAPATPLVTGPVFTIYEYLEQVDHSNEGLKASTLLSDSGRLKTAEARLLVLPQAYAEFQRLNDQLVNPLFSFYQKFLQTQLTAGIRQTTPYGVRGSISYNTLYADYVGLRPRYYEGHPRIDLAVSLLRNRFGTETRSQYSLLEATQKATQYSERYKAKQLKAQAKVAYVRLSGIRELLAVQQRSLERAKLLLNSQKRRYDLNLGEGSDYFQAQANLKSKEYSVQDLQDQLTSAEKNFNRMRGELDAPIPQLTRTFELSDLVVPARQEIRDDVNAAIQTLKVSEAQSRMNTEKLKPDLEVYTTVTLNSRDSTQSKAFRDSFQTNIPTSVIGVRFNAPLGFGAVRDANRGYAKDQEAADHNRRQKILDQETEWRDLNQRFTRAKERYEIAKNLLDIQKRKYESERTRLRQGRTTTYQTLTFEQEYDAAEANVIQNQTEILDVFFQLMTFGESV